MSNSIFTEACFTFISGIPFRALRQTTMIAVALSMDLVCGTVFLLNCVHLTRMSDTFRGKLKNFLFTQ